MYKLLNHMKCINNLLILKEVKNISIEKHIFND